MAGIRRTRRARFHRRRLGSGSPGIAPDTTAARGEKVSKCTAGLEIVQRGKRFGKRTSWCYPGQQIPRRFAPRKDNRLLKTGYAPGWIRRIRAKAAAATNAAAGMVKIQAQTILLATPQRTAERRCVAPTPTIAPVIV